ncbi:hypothetical protein D3C80_2082130 [compost metagenome]
MLGILGTVLFFRRGVLSWGEEDSSLLLCVGLVFQGILLRPRQKRRNLTSYLYGEYLGWFL